MIAFVIVLALVVLLALGSLVCMVGGRIAGPLLPPVGEVTRAHGEPTQESEASQ